MIEPYYEDSTATLYHGDALAVAKGLAASAADCIVTSPPYYGLRDYGVPGQYGQEASPAEYVKTMRRLFAELRRVLADDGTLWLNLGDSYVGKPASGRGKNSALTSRSVAGHQGGGGYVADLPDKNLIGIPWRVAFALQDDGWILRNAIVWHKPNAMPESVTDRLSTRHELVFLFSKSRRYWFDLNSIRQKAATAERTGPRRSYAPGSASSMSASGQHQAMTGPFAGLPLNENGRNPGDIWEIPTTPFPGAHFAVMPSALAERCIQAGCKPGGVVLDPFSGSGTTGLAAAKHGRRYVGIELNAEYLDLSLRTRLQQPGLDFGEVA
ncbi:site-specific DNA-methyltransferase [Nocardia cyriacigeorgica]|uniref:DNA-methyltransferase n=1 Tax=Nocardia cyriacigeorgica TaxID=135487 RepID=UPI0018940CBC|nr:site-specific DNA-methyltransferase [Nocardia cyriacigeorgica]MBF6326476.1 site-specific DNA-methyltransferase [Nocardia cyriacigeorgica]